jgi:uridine kinase
MANVKCIRIQGVSGSGKTEALYELQRALEPHGLIMTLDEALKEIRHTKTPITELSSRLFIDNCNDMTGLAELKEWLGKHASPLNPSRVTLYYVVSAPDDYTA